MSKGEKMSQTEKNVLSWLKIPSYLELARTIENVPKSAREISAAIALQDTRVAEMLEYLEGVNAVEHTSSGWILTTLAKQVLAKYFQ